MTMTEINTEDLKKELIEKINSGDIIGTYAPYIQWLSSPKFEYDHENSVGKMYLNQVIQNMIIQLIKTNGKKEIQKVVDFALQCERNFEEYLTYYKKEAEKESQKTCRHKNYTNYTDGYDHDNPYKECNDCHLKLPV